MVVVTQTTEDDNTYIQILPCTCEEDLEKVFNRAVDSVRHYCTEIDEGKEVTDDMLSDYYTVQQCEDFYSVYGCESPFNMCVEKMRLPYCTESVKIKF
jgi:hypothetical protein